MDNGLKGTFVHVEIWSDIACPWCYVGKRRFDAALAAFEHRDEVRVTWRSFELDPHAPREREGDRAAHLAAKYGTTREQAVAMQERMTEVAAGEGLDFHFETARSGNTFDAHRLLHLAAAHDAQDELEERLFHAYLTEGELISDPVVLERLGVEAGLPADAAREVLVGDRYAADVREDERIAASFGITAVPFFVWTARSARRGLSRRRSCAICSNAPGRRGRGCPSWPPARAAASTAADGCPGEAGAAAESFRLKPWRWDR